jgi:hypothetical protein
MCQTYALPSRVLSDEEAETIRRKLAEGWRGPILLRWLEQLLQDRDERRQKEREAEAQERRRKEGPALGEQPALNELDVAETRTRHGLGGDSKTAFAGPCDQQNTRPLVKTPQSWESPLVIWVKCLVAAGEATG